MPDDTEMKRKRLADLLWMAKNIHRKDIERERELLTCKWFDYRFISPLEATELFVEAYRAQYKIEFAREVDRNRADDVDGVRLEQLYRDPKMRTQIWRARQRADETGMPYDVYMQASFSFASRKSVVNDGGRTRARMLLSVSQLHHPNRAADHWVEYRADYWADRLDTRAVCMPNAPAYRIELFEDLPAQREFRETWPRIAAASSASMTGWLLHFSHVMRQIVNRPFNCGSVSSLIDCPCRGHGPFRGHGLMMMFGSSASTC